MMLKRIFTFSVLLFFALVFLFPKIFSISHFFEDIKYTDWEWGRNHYQQKLNSPNSVDNQMLHELDSQNWEKRLWILPVLYGLKEIRVRENGKKVVYNLDKIRFALLDMVRGVKKPQFLSDTYTESWRGQQKCKAGNQEYKCYVQTSRWVNKRNWLKPLSITGSGIGILDFTYIEGKGREQLLKLFDPETKKFKKVVEEELLKQANEYLKNIFAEIKPFIIDLKTKKNRFSQINVGHTYSPGSVGGAWLTNKNRYDFLQLADPIVNLESFKFQDLNPVNKKHFFELFVQAANDKDLIKWAFLKQTFSDTQGIDKLWVNSFFKIALSLGIQGITVVDKKYDWSFLFDENKKPIKLEDLYQNKAKIDKLKELGFFLGDDVFGNKVRDKIRVKIREKLNQYKEKIQSSLDHLTKKSIFQVTFNGKNYTLDYLLEESSLSEKASVLQGFAGDELLNLAKEVSADNFNQRFYKLIIQRVLEAFAKNNIFQFEVNNVVYDISDLISKENLFKPTLELQEEAKNQLFSLYSASFTEQQLNIHLENVLELRKIQKRKKEQRKKPIEEEQARKNSEKKQQSKNLSVGLATGGGVLVAAGVGGFLYWFFRIRK